jgi:hypothetical protein
LISFKKFNSFRSELQTTDSLLRIFWLLQVFQVLTKQVLLGLVSCRNLTLVLLETVDESRGKTAGRKLRRCHRWNWREWLRLVAPGTLRRHRRERILRRLLGHETI